MFQGVEIGFPIFRTNRNRRISLTKQKQVHQKPCGASVAVGERMNGHQTVIFSPEVQAKLDRLVTESGRSADEFIQDAIAIYVDELTEVRATLDSRYDDLDSGSVVPLDGEAFFEQLRLREEELLRKPSAR